MIYAYDQAMQMPVKDLYDTLIMAMAINAAKDMYEKGLKLLDDFHKLYGDFFSPIRKDMEKYNNLVLNPVRDAVNEIYAIGGDPIRSPEGRAALARIIRNVPIGDVNKLRLSAETAKIYLKALAEAIAKGLYDPEVDKFFNPVGLDEWDTLGNDEVPGMGIWSRPAPTTILTLHDATTKWFNSRTPHDLTPEQMSAEGYVAIPGYNYTGWLYNDLYKTAGKMTPGWQSSLEAKYYRALAKKQLEAAGEKDITPEKIEERLLRNVAEANREWIVEPTKKADEFALDAYKTRNDVAAYAAKAAIEDKYKALLFLREHPELSSDAARLLELSQRILNRIDSNYNNAVINMAYEYAVANRDARKKYEALNDGKKRSIYDSKFWGKLADDLRDGKEVDLTKYGLTDKYGNATQKLRDFALRRFKNSKNADLYWKLRSYDPASDIEKQIFRNLYSGTDRTTKLNGTDYNEMSFSSSGIHYAPIRKAGVLGLNGTTTKLQKEFDSFLTKSKSILGYVDNSPNTIANIPVAGSDNITDIQGGVLIPAEYIETFYNKVKLADNSIGSLDDVVAKLGLHKRSYNQVKFNVKGESATMDQTYYLVPIIRSVRITPDDINQQYNKETYTGTEASKERNYATEAGLEWLKNN